MNINKDHIHLHLNYLPSKSVSEIVKKLKGRSSRKLQQEFPELRKRYWGQYFWAIGYGCWSTGNITDEMINEYLEHHKKQVQKIMITSSLNDSTKRLSVVLQTYRLLFYSGLVCLLSNIYLVL